MVRILYFGKLSDLTGVMSEEVSLPSPAMDTHALRAWLDAEHDCNGALVHKSVRIAINNEIVADPHPVSDSDEVAFMPPVGGG